MSSISNFATTRRRLLALLAGWPLLARANVAPENLLPGVRRWGSGEFRRFGFLVYEATLWAGEADPTSPPLALRLTYKRALVGKRIAEASVKEMRQLGMADERELERWGQQMERLFPDVVAGDAITGLYLPEGARFLLNQQPLGAINDARFARAFFGIWLDPRTSAPELRSALLKRPEA